MNLLVENPALNNRPLASVPGRREMRVVVSRIKRAGEAEAQTPRRHRAAAGRCDSRGGTRTELERLRTLMGRESEVDLRTVPGRVTDRRIVVTHKSVLGKTLRELGLEALYGVVVTRVTRADIEMSAVPDLHLQFGDMLVVVGDEPSLDHVAELLGNSLKALNETNFIPIFIGIALGCWSALCRYIFPECLRP